MISDFIQITQNNNLLRNSQIHSRLSEYSGVNKTDTNPQAAPITASVGQVGGATVRGGGVCRSYIHTHTHTHTQIQDCRYTNVKLNFDLWPVILGSKMFDEQRI